MQVLVQLSNAPRRQLNFRGITVDNLLCPIGCRCQHDLHLIRVLIHGHRPYRLIHTRVQLRRRRCRRRLPLKLRLPRSTTTLLIESRACLSRRPFAHENGSTCGGASPPVRLRSTATTIPSDNFLHDLGGFPAILFALGRVAALLGF